MPEHPQPLSERLRRGLLTLGSRVLKTALALALILASALAFVLPVWYLATRHPQEYTVGVLALMTIGTLALLVLSVRADIRRLGFSEWLHSRLLPWLRNRIPVLVLEVIAILALLFAALERYAPAALLAFLFFLGLGMRLFR